MHPIQRVALFYLKSEGVHPLISGGYEYGFRLQEAELVELLSKASEFTG